MKESWLIKDFNQKKHFDQLPVKQNIAFSSNAVQYSPAALPYLMGVYLAGKIADQKEFSATLIM